MKMFSFDEKPNDSGANSSEIPSGQGSVADSMRESAAGAAREAVKRSPRKSRRDARTADSELQEQINGKIAEQLSSLQAPEMWEALLCMPGDAALAITGKKRWEFAEKERRTIGLSGSALAQTMMITNPKALAIFMFVSVMGSAYLPRCMMELRDMKIKRDEEERERQRAREYDGQRP